MLHSHFYKLWCKVSLRCSLSHIFSFIFVLGSKRKNYRFLWISVLPLTILLFILECWWTVLINAWLWLDFSLIGFFSFSFFFSNLRAKSIVFQLTGSTRLSANYWVATKKLSKLHRQVSKFIIFHITNIHNNWNI